MSFIYVIIHKNDTKQQQQQKYLKHCAAASHENEIMQTECEQLQKKTKQLNIWTYLLLHRPFFSPTSLCASLLISQKEKKSFVCYFFYLFEWRAWQPKSYNKLLQELARPRNNPVCETFKWNNYGASPWQKKTAQLIKKSIEKQTGVDMVYIKYGKWLEESKKKTHHTKWCMSSVIDVIRTFWSIVNEPKKKYLSFQTGFLFNFHQQAYDCASTFSHSVFRYLFVALMNNNITSPDEFGWMESDRGRGREQG